MTDDSMHVHEARRAVYGRACVSSSQPLASAVGLQVLADGGNAADAAIAMAAMLAVSEPTSNGIGGDFVALHHGANGVTDAILGIGASPRALTREAYLTSPPPSWASPHMVTVPGAVAAWQAVKTRFGSAEVPWARLIRPAAQVAREGFYVHRTTAAFWAAAEPFLREVEPSTPFAPAPRAGEVFKIEALANVLDEIAENRAAAFYTGRVAKAIVDAVTRRGGTLSMADLAEHETTFATPLQTTYKEWRILEPGAPTHGAVALLALNILSRMHMPTVEQDLPLETHLMVDALRLAYMEAAQRIGDGHDAADSTSAMTDPKLADDLAMHMRQDYKCTLPEPKTGALRDSGTVQFCVIDKWGNAVSAVQSNYKGFGTGIVPDGCGFTLHNRGRNFCTMEGHANCVAGGKRPYHTIMPGMMVRRVENSEGGGEEVVAFGVMGSFMQPQGHVLVVRGLVDHGLDPQQALDARRFRVTGSFSAIESAMGDDAVLVEEDMDPAVVDGLQKRGHDVRVASVGCFGRGHICARRKDGRTVGGADCRADGLALVWM